MALIALWALPPRDAEDWLRGWFGNPSDPSPELAAFREVQVEVRRLAFIYQGIEWHDSVRVLAEVAVEEGDGFLARVPDSAAAGSEAALTEAVRLQLQAAEVGRPAMPVGAVVMETGYGLPPGVAGARFPSGNWELFVSRDEESPFCFLVDPELGAGANLQRTLARMTWTGSDSSGAPNPLGPCGLHAKYGSPGDGVFAWLRAGGYALGEGSLAYWDQRILGGRAERRFGSRRIYRLSTNGEACVMGLREGCLRAFLKGGGGSPTGSSFPVAFTLEGAGSDAGFGGMRARVLYDLEEEFGSERFARFWTSDLEVEEAFRGVYGEPVEEWLVRWAQARWGPLKVGPQVPLQATFLSFLTLGLFTGLGLYMGRRRG
jgi:hypothetical protein